MPGLQVNIDGVTGTVKRSGGGRTLVDFNHPLSGQEVQYKVKVTKLVTDEVQKLKSLLKIHFNLADIDAKKEGDKTKVISDTLSKLPDEYKDKIMEKIKELIPEAKNVVFEDKEPKKEQ